MPSGFSRCSVQGPLFLIFVNKTPNDIKLEVRLFAYDVKQLVWPSKEITLLDLNKLKHCEYLEIKIQYRIM